MKPFTIAGKALSCIYLMLFGRRMLSEIYALDSKQKNNCRKRRSHYQNKLREISKSDEYKDFVAEKLMPAELASSLVETYIRVPFLGLLSTLAHFHENDKEISGRHLDSWLTEAVLNRRFRRSIQPQWKKAISKSNLFETLKNSFEIDFETYEKL
jgi:hydroxymethylglutaryl-CoA synthase